MENSAGEIQKRLRGLQLSEELHGEAKSPVADLLDLRSNGNQRFQHGDKKGAITCYSECIEIYNKEAMDVFVSCYSNRAEAFLKLEEYGKAVEDCEKALQLHSTHLKSLLRKGRALHGLGEYNLACACFGLALEQSPDAKEIKSQYDKSKKMNEENQQGKFDLSAYFLNGFRQQYIPEVSNYIGPVIIKKSPVHGRGLFATKDVEVGDTLLVENAIAVSGIYRRSMDFLMEENPPSMLEGLHQDTVERAAARAMSCPRILRQLQHLTDSSWLEDAEVPDMELFKVNNGSWNKFGENPVNFQINTFDLRKSMELNGLVTYISTYEEDPGNEKSVIEQCGLWGLPSFINHSCFPNAKYIVVGKAMFIIAVRGIAAEEEITVPYFRSLYPLVDRERDFTPLGFHCECKRCVLERSLGPSCRKLSQKIHNYCRSLINTIYISPRDMQSLVGFALDLEKIDARDEEKKLIRSSFYCLYKYLFAAAKVYTGFCVLSRSLPTVMDVAEALWHAEPGCGYSLKMYQMLLEGARGKQRDLPFKKAMENSIAIIGKQKEHVLKALVLSKFDAVFQSVRPWNAREVYSITYTRISMV
ncbi:hypothetical protein SUGI_1091130 [Cryptomeria japonica]|uniref:uncharacterized protein LOC131034908 n=1 Tax=Cryptomeria japonica TaxID=3369 RepID=UPI002414C9F7|nr:uncharacterized protein LOC131034908 [Cryptomeria japonica]GLJ51308.1 hypothetical protein SUGI_1091130 [Cryptomeria japonica]